MSLSSVIVSELKNRGEDTSWLQSHSGLLSRLLQSANDEGSGINDKGSGIDGSTSVVGHVEDAEEDVVILSVTRRESESGGNTDDQAKVDDRRLLRQVQHDSSPSSSSSTTTLLSSQQPKSNPNSGTAAVKEEVDPPLNPTLTPNFSSKKKALTAAPAVGVGGGGGGRGGGGGGVRGGAPARGAAPSAAKSATTGSVKRRSQIVEGFGKQGAEVEILPSHLAARCVICALYPDNMRDEIDRESDIDWHPRLKLPMCRRKFDFNGKLLEGKTHLEFIELTGTHIDEEDTTIRECLVCHSDAEAFCCSTEGCPNTTCKECCEKFLSKAAVKHLQENESLPFYCWICDKGAHLRLMRAFYKMPIPTTLPNKKRCMSFPGDIISSSIMLSRNRAPPDQR